MEATVYEMRWPLLALGLWCATGDRVAILFVGHKVRAPAVATWGSFVLEPLRQEHRVTVFWCVATGHWITSQYEQMEAEQLRARAVLAQSANATGATVFDDGHANFTNQYERMASCYDFTTEVGTFDVYVRARGDTPWVEPFPLELLRIDDAVSLKFRELFYRNETRTANFALSVPKIYDCGTGFGKLSRVREEVRAAGSDRGKQMDDAHLVFCGTTDDQFAVVPRKYAAAYFSLELGYPGRPRADGAAFFEHAGYVPSPQAEASLRICHGWSWEEVFDQGWKGKWTGKGLRDALGEMRLTWRLAGRGVPTRVARVPLISIGPPIPQRGHWDEVQC